MRSRALKPGGLCVFTVRNTSDPDYGHGIHCGEDLFENQGFIVHFFDRAKVERVAKGYQIIGIDEFEEGKLPRRLFRVTLRKPSPSARGDPFPPTCEEMLRRPWATSPSQHAQAARDDDEFAQLVRDDCHRQREGARHRSRDEHHDHAHREDDVLFHDCLTALGER